MRILLVEDEQKIAQAIKKGLEQESYAVDMVHDGKSAIQYGGTEEYDVIILDRMLPGGMDGSEICANLRQKGVKAPVLMLTAKDTITDRVAGLDAGADDYLVKPFAFEELLARLRALTRRPPVVQDTKLQISDLELDSTNSMVTRAGKVIDLSAKEFALLQYLMQNAGKLVRKEQIMNHVWDYDADILPNSVEVYIGYLRAKLEKPFKGPALIHTVRGFGYKMMELT